MKLLLDTHALVWWLNDSPRLGREAEDCISDAANEVWVSAVSAFEIAQKFRLGKMPSAERLARRFDAEVSNEGFSSLSISASEARMAGILPGNHRDPFDRMLIAQAMLNDLTLVSNERLFDSFGVSRLW